MSSFLAASAIMDSECLELRREVREAINALSAPTSGAVRITKALVAMKRYVGVADGPITVREKEEFAKAHFSSFLYCLLNQLSPEWLELLAPEQQKELWDYFFLEGPPDQAFLVLLDSLSSTRSSFFLTKVTSLLESFLQQGGLSALIWKVSQEQTPVASPLLHETLLNKVVCFPDHVANQLQVNNPAVFYPQNYFPLLGEEIVQVLQKISDGLRGGRDCSIAFISQVLGKICVQGRRDEVLNCLIPRLVDLTESDCIWQRICWRLLEAVPERWMETVVTGLVQIAPGANVLCRLLGNLVVKNRKAEYVITQKLLLLQYGHKALKELLQTWALSSAVRHSPVEQQLYISKAILIALSHLREEELEAHRQELLGSMLAGVQCHLDSSVPQVRRLGMIVAESISACITTEGPCLKFQYEDDEQSQELRSLLESPSSEPILHSLSSNGKSKNSCESPTPDTGIPNSAVPSDSELDSDDELPVYDMSHDTPLKKAKAPVYIRDCIEALVSSEDVEKFEATLASLGTLIRKSPAATKEVSVELAKVLLHLEDKGSLAQFVHQRHRALVAVTIIDPVPVSQYLIAQFYAMNYSLRQRMDILDVLASAAQELSQPKTTTSPDATRPAIELLSSTLSSDATSGAQQDWRRIVDERIQRKTRRFAKEASDVPPSVPNRFNAVVGHFFFPLIQNFDRPLVTFDLLGEDCLVLGRLVHTLGILMYFALHTTVAHLLGKALLEFVWSLRFHSDIYVRQGLLFCISLTLLSVPKERLIADMTDELLETQYWLADVAEQDADSDCRRLAMQNLLLLENLKQGLNPGSPE
ncbi:telomere length regulation protein TEL2 homolog isoform X2 [Ambystoma mexicanum]|uniref:telomere length regulation protein TEL2 homolog isoform X2 n=1 Tax=Ambystoma mexicanum TaxID=8296 RepID=UPI0037E841A6